MAQPISYTALESDFIRSVGAEAPTFSDGTSPSFFTSSSFLYALFFVVIVVAASYRYALAGMLRIQATEEGIRKSKEEFTRVTYGLLGVFGLWLILATVNKDMLTGDVGLGALKSTITSAGGGYIPGQTPVTPPVTPPNDPETPTDSENINRVRLVTVGITVNKPACVGANTSCTNLARIDESILVMLEKLAKECSSCKGELMVTGGTEPGHSATSNHTKGKAVDLSFKESLLTFLKKNGENVGNNTRCNTKYKWGGYVFWDEEQGCDSVGGVRHFHISLTGR
ncbi:MAG: hypothetical protein KBC41_01235 [Candidatus Pacebacteria bacterium]|nr:hypothetical protein [Candidatus Paceibacterota bacterium]MBP9866686.1 hypothetical protein [Candidatus Paceibacterota bacterium]